jgi:electron transfer flavoprotein beta subunit
MNICVCVKQVAETYARTGRDPERHFLDPVDRIHRLNPYDEAAMLLAVKAASQIQDAQVNVLTLGPILAEDELWRLMALGGDRLCHIEPSRSGSDDSPLDSWSKAQVLAQAVRDVGGDLVLCGKESIDRQNQLVAPFLAQVLGRPLVACIVGMNIEAGGAGVRATKNAGKGAREVIECDLPAVCSVDLGALAAVAPAYAAKQQARRRSVTRLFYDAGDLEPRTRRLRVYAPRPRPKPVSAPDSRLPGYERVVQLLAGSRIAKKGRIVTGSPETQVDEILRFLEAHDIGPAAAQEPKQE